MKKLFLALIITMLGFTVAKAGGWETLVTSSYSITGSTIATSLNVYYIICTSTGLAATSGTLYLADDNGARMTIVSPTGSHAPIQFDFTRTPITFKGSLRQWSLGTDAAAKLVILYQRIGTR
jgi:hypothetical protein